MTIRLPRGGFLRSPLLAVLLLLAGTGSIFAQQSKNLPPKPPAYFNDEANVVDAETAHAINEQLAQFERDTSNQILVAIYKSLPDGAAVDQYSIDTFNSWGVGQKGKNNGAVLFLYVNDHKMFLCTGRGLEGALPDAICKEIISEDLAPYLRRGDYGGGIRAGVTAMISATKGEYKGIGQTMQERQQALQPGTDTNTNESNLPFPGFLIFIFIIFFISIFFHRAGFGGVPMIYTGGGWGGGGGFGGSGFGGGGSSFGGGGGGFSGFSGGGGSSAGGGAGGGW